ncbi:hypothetical protein E2562_014901 [Oryza meyeriana var. granulata]|uniref:Uncharacterized protein n=1 Tax=Oryza meyeriana var. granulata TaxID=110450 RepID=A0A6G1EI99_9ORYZ|nr:hypothetical protein E2562_014901 [Oryza meyeriana var. granulata]
MVDGEPSPLKSHARAVRFFRGSRMDLAALPSTEAEANADSLVQPRNAKFTRYMKECVELLEYLGMPVLQAKVTMNFMGAWFWSCDCHLATRCAGGPPSTPSPCPPCREASSRASPRRASPPLRYRAAPPLRALQPSLRHLRFKPYIIVKGIDKGTP